jgi:predicted transcriptional regulator
MASNHKLTELLRGRTINGSSNQDTQMTILFTDGSMMTIKTAGSINMGATGDTIEKARQAGTQLHLDMQDGSTLTIQTAEETSCVMVRDKDGAMEYAD